MDYIKIVDDILENSGKKYDSACIVNKEGVIEYTKRINNDFDMFFYDKGRVGKKFFEAFPDIDMSNSSVLRAIGTGKVAHNERQILMAGNVKVVVEGDTYPIFDDDGNIQGAVDAVRYLEYYNYNEEKDDEYDAALNSIVTNNPKLKRLKDSLPEIARNDSNVFLYGETGTGKGIFAHVIHLLSKRNGRPMITQNCAAIPPNLMESTFFGTELGGFTGAENKQGLFELADHGTLFLDEINSMDVQMQAKLLTAIENGTIRRVGGQKDIPFDTRIICASNEPPARMIQSGRFREDLYYRLNAVSVLMPALRERRDDIYLLFRKFTSDFSEKYGMNKVTLTPDAVALLKNYRWPGNIRQLKNVAETVSALESSRISPVSGKCELNAETLSGYIPKDVPNMLPVRSSFQDDNVSPGEREAIIRMIYQLRQEVDYLKGVVLGTGKQESVKALPQSSGLPDDGFVSQASAGAEWQEPLEIRDSSHRDHDMPDHVPQFRDTEYAKAAPDDQDGDDLSLQKAGTDLIRKALEKYHGNRKQAAAELGISERTLYRKLKSIEEN